MAYRFIKLAVSLVAGTTFGVGLGISGLANPDKVLQFLTLSGNWSPALLFTMAAGILVSMAGFRFALRRGPIFERMLHLPVKSDVDRTLVVGAAVFGLGWGLAGFCPGPAITGLSSGMVEPVLFVLAMIAGTLLHRATFE